MGGERTTQCRKGEIELKKMGGSGGREAMGEETAVEDWRD
jgi:hypothetical protein